MGRYAFFNTGFEYKFAFGIQNSDDILLFGGLGNPFGSAVSEGPYHEWKSSTDSSYVLEKIHQIEEDIDLSEVEFSDFSANLDGTHELKSYLSNLYDRYDNKAIAKYILGCAIYHQLIYKDVLTVEYEL